MADNLEWTEKRIQQLEELESLLKDCEKINTSTNIIHRLTMIQASAEHLLPFVRGFLSQLARGE